MVNPPVITFLPVFTQSSYDLAFAGTLREQDDRAVPRGPVNLLDQERIIGDPADFHDDPLCSRHLARP